MACSTKRCMLCFWYKVGLTTFSVRLEFLSGGPWWQTNIKADKARKNKISWRRYGTVWNFIWLLDGYKLFCWARKGKIAAGPRLVFTLWPGLYFHHPNPTHYPCPTLTQTIVESEFEPTYCIFSSCWMWRSFYMQNLYQTRDRSCKCYP